MPPTRRCRLCLWLLLAMLCLSLTPVALAAGPEPPRMPAPPLGQLDPSTLGALSSGGKLLAGASTPKLSSDLARLLPATGNTLEQVPRQAANLTIDQGRVQVEVLTAMDRRDEATGALQALGVEVTAKSELAGLLQAWVPLDRLAEAAAQLSVDFMRAPALPILYDTDLSGFAAPSEGLVASNATAWHSAGQRGAGVKVAIVDGGFVGYEALLGTHLPASVTVRNFVDGENDSQVGSTTPHGTACAEIVHDMAPDATLYLVKVRTNLDLEEAVTWLRDTAQVQVISTSMGWACWTPGDGSGFFADLVHNARAAGILWATAAGNERQNHWLGASRDDDSDGFHEFDAGLEINALVNAAGQPVLIPAGYVLSVALRWNDWDAVDQDLDLYITRWDGSTWTIVAGSENYQNGGAGQLPIEWTAYYTSGGSASYGFLVRRFSGTRSLWIELSNPSSPARLSRYVAGWSIADLGDAPDAITVAAANVGAPYAQESYSSEGPLKGTGGSMSQGLPKPDLTSYANVSTASYASAFNGTSAATPHVAGAAALILGAFPGYTPDQIEYFLLDRATDLGAAGYDHLYGIGRLWLGNAPSAITPTATATRTSTATVTRTVAPATATLTPANPYGYATPTRTGTRISRLSLPMIVRSYPPVTATPTRTRTPTGTLTPTPSRTPTPTATVDLSGPWIDTQNEAAVRLAYATTLGSSQPAIGWTGSVASCNAGSTSAAFRADVLATINFFRRMAGVQAIGSLDSTMSNKAQKAALMMAANHALSHDPPSSWHCYSADGDEGAGSSNLSLGNYGRGAIMGQMQDAGSNNSAVGHRRWILYPQTQKMGTGDVSGVNWTEIANALSVFDMDNMWGPRPSTRDSYVAWPPPGFVPQPLVYARWSLSVAGANFGSANVSITKNGSGKSVAKQPITNGYGENTLVWEINSDTAAVGDVYNVSVSNVVVGGSPRTISYQVRVISAN